MFKANCDLQARLIFYTTQHRIERVFSILSKITTSRKQFGFTKIAYTSRVLSYETKLRSEQEKIQRDFANVLHVKDQEVSMLISTNNEQLQTIKQIKAADITATTELKEKESFVAALSAELEQKRARKLNPTDLNQQTKILEKRVERKNFLLSSKITMILPPPPPFLAARLRRR